MPESGLEASSHRLLDDLVARFPLGYRPNLFWKNLRVTAGVAYYRSGEIALSRLVLKTEEQMRETLLHEYAHLLAFVRQGRRGAGHGDSWRAAMRELGAEPVVRHRYEVQRNAKRQAVSYRCVRCGCSFTRHRRLPRRQKYVHKGCGGDLRLESVQAVTAVKVAS